MKALPILACLACELAIAGGVSAAQVPTAGALDARIKTVTYNPSNVVRIIGHFGYSTDIEFASGEEVLSVALGDTLAWAVAPVKNHIFVKPREPNAATNMTIITNKRVYQFDLWGDMRKHEDRRDYYYQVRFLYPQIASAAAVRQADAKLVQAKLEAAVKPRNWDYWACGPWSIRPTQVYDDGRFTYFTFPAAQKVPSITVVSDDESESTTNGVMRGSEYVVFSTGRKFALRRDNTVGCVENRAYNPYGVYTPTNTTSQDVRRVLKGSARTEPVPISTRAPWQKEKPADDDHAPPPSTFTAPPGVGPMLLPPASPTNYSPPRYTPSAQPSMVLPRNAQDMNHVRN